MPKSKKTSVIEALFDARWQGRGKPLRDPVVTLVQVQDAIRKFNRTKPAKKLSTKNPANFLKDFIRKKKSANENWPASVLKRGYTARQTTGEGLCFEFVKLDPGQSEPFPETGVRPSANDPTHRIQSASMPLASRRLGRKDEAWLIQVLSRLHVVETHLALHSTSKFLQIDLLQTNVKLSRAEIDALYLGVEDSPQTPDTQLREVLITCEAKGMGDDILLDQIVAQVKAVFRLKTVKQDVVLPIAAKAIGPSRIFVVQFLPVDRSSAFDLSSVVVGSQAIYELVPTVPGIGK